jgi:hypothetical protein
MNRVMRAACAGVLSLISFAACGEPDAHPTFSIETTGRALGILFNDLNGNGALDVGDVRVAGWQVRLLGLNQAVVASVVTDTAGIFRFEKVPIGGVNIDVDRTRLGDTLQLFGASVGNAFTVASGDTITVTVGFTYPTVSLAAVDSLPAGRRVFVEGLSLNNVVPNGTREIHLRTGSRALRVTNIVRKPVSTGDSVRVLGRRATEGGRAVLTAGEITVIRVSVADAEPYELTTKNASTANGNALAADLARVRTADLIRSRNEASDVILTVDDGTGPLEIILRSFLGADASFFNADSVRIREATGLLVPYTTDAGASSWRLAPRAIADLRTEPDRRPPGAPVAAASPSPASPASEQRFPGTVAPIRKNVVATPQQTP